MNGSDTTLVLPSNKTLLLNEQGIRDNILGFTLLIIDVFIIVLNLLMIMVIVRFRTKNATDIFVLALACTDFIKGIVPVPMSIYIYVTDWYLKIGTLSCKLFGWIAFTTNSGSMLILALMSIERFWAIVKPFSYKRWITPRKVQIISVIAMIFTALASALPVAGLGRMLPYNKGAYSHFDYSRYSTGTVAYATFILVYGFGMLFIVMIMYSFVFYKIRNLIHRHRRMSTQNRGFATKSLRSLNLKTEKMFSYLTVVLMVLFWISWLPFLIVVLTYQLNIKVSVKNLDLYAIRIAVINSMLNPLVCATLCKPYRRGILYYVRVCCSFVGFERPHSDIWDPWRRRTSVRRLRSQANDVASDREERVQSLTDIGQSSFTDSVITNNIDYGRYRLPSVLETYESYRAHKQNDVNKNTETQHEETGEEERNTIQTNGSIPDDDNINSDDTCAENKREPSYDQRRKLQLLDRVQKYLIRRGEHTETEHEDHISAGCSECEQNFLIPKTERNGDVKTEKQKSIAQRKHANYVSLSLNELEHKLKQISFDSERSSSSSSVQSLRQEADNENVHCSDEDGVVSSSDSHSNIEDSIDDADVNDACNENHVTTTTEFGIDIMQTLNTISSSNTTADSFTEIELTNERNCLD